MYENKLRGKGWIFADTGGHVIVFFKNMLLKDRRKHCVGISDECIVVYNTIYNGNGFCEDGTEVKSWQLIGFVSEQGIEIDNILRNEVDLEDVNNPFEYYKEHFKSMKEWFSEVQMAELLLAYKTYTDEDQLDASCDTPDTRENMLKRIGNLRKDINASLKEAKSSGDVGLISEFTKEIKLLDWVMGDEKTETPNDSKEILNFLLKRNNSDEPAVTWALDECNKYRLSNKEKIGILNELLSRSREDLFEAIRQGEGGYIETDNKRIITLQWAMAELSKQSISILGIPLQRIRNMQYFIENLESMCITEGDAVILLNSMNYDNDSNQLIKNAIVKYFEGPEKYRLFERNFFLRRISIEEAKKLFGVVDIYRLYDDGTEGILESKEEIETADALGVEINYIIDSDGENESTSPKLGVGINNCFKVQL
jgi:hypothetical protein